MPRPWRIRYAGAKYHLTQRGNGAQGVFLCHEDYERFVLKLTRYIHLNPVKVKGWAGRPREVIGRTQREVGKYYGYSGNGGVSKQRKRLALRMASDKPLSVCFDQPSHSL